MQYLITDTLFPMPKSADEALYQCRVVERAASLFTTGGYSWYVSDRDPYLFGVCSPDGAHYGVDMRQGTCTCKAFKRDSDCKHRIAVAHSAECQDASLAKQADLLFDFAASDHADRLVRETGFVVY